MLRTAVLTALLTAGLAAPASAAVTLTGQDGRLHVTAAPGEANVISVMPLDTGPIVVRSNVTLDGCAPWGADGERLCSVVRAPVIDLGDEDDSVGVSDAGTEDLIGTTEVDGGPGDDTISTGYSDDVLRGGTGDDHVIAGDLGDDDIDGGPGVDWIEARWGDDTIAVRDGEQDKVECGEGEDTVTADAVDVVVDCEHVQLPPVADPPGGDKPGGDKPGGDKPAGDKPAGDKPGGGVPPSGGPAPLTAAPAVVAPRSTTAPADRRAPRLSVKRRGRVLTLRADEACTVTLRAGTRRLTRRLRAGRALKVRVPGRARTVRLTARDGAGNVASASRRLARP